MLRSLAIEVSSSMLYFYAKSNSCDVVISPPTSLKKLMKADAIPIWAARQGSIDSAISRLFPELSAVQASLLCIFVHSLHSSLLVLSLIPPQLQLCCAGTSSLLRLISLHLSSKQSTRYQSKLAKRPILTASITSAVRSPRFSFSWTSF